MRRRRWSDNDHHLGPLTFAYRESWRPFAAILSSGSTERESPGCCLRLQALGCTLICELPAIIRPSRRWVDLSGKEWAKSGGYWDEHPREYGFSLNDGHLSISLGRQTDDSTTEQRWGCFLPWREWRTVARRVFNADGSLAGELPGGAGAGWFALRDKVIKSGFAIVDYDGERIEVETYAEEFDTRLGTGWFKWLGYLAPMRRGRSLAISFKNEVGPEKGSWKGGTLGHGIEMLPGESQEAAFRRYCDKEHRAKYGTYRVTFAEAA